MTFAAPSARACRARSVDETPASSHSGAPTRPGRRRARPAIRRLTAGNRIQVGDIQLPDAEAVDIGSRQRQRVTRCERGAGDRGHRCIAFASSAATVDRASGDQVQNADHPHGDIIAALATHLDAPVIGIVMTAG